MMSKHATTTKRNEPFHVIFAPPAGLGAVYLFRFSGFTSNFNMGNLLVWLLTAAVDVYAIWQQPIHHWLHGTIPGKICVRLFCLCLAFLYAALLGFVAFSGYANPATGQEKVVIVLGAGLRKDRPSLLLRYRLDKAYEYAVAHPDALVITTGGQGRDEWVPEGQAMRNYLIEKGLDSQRVLAECKSTSTEENFSLCQRDSCPAGSVLRSRSSM